MVSAMGDDEKPPEPHLRPFKPKPLPPPEPGAMASEEHRRLSGLPSLRSMLMESQPELDKVLPLPRAKRALSMAELWAKLSAVPDWLIPGLIERDDRIVITGDEGYGKSTLLRQLAICAAIGENALSPNGVNGHTPRKVLLIDLENSETQIRTESLRLRSMVPADLAHHMDSHLELYIDTAGLVLDDPKDRDKDRALVNELMDTYKPDLLIVGPLYKMQGGDPTEEQNARELARYLDWLRGKHRFALIIEAHAPHNQKRPYGWSGWKRWPEIGLHLDSEGTLSHWRGARGERSWPAALSRGGSGNGAPSGARWLWVPKQSAPLPERDSRAERLAQDELDVVRMVREARRPLTANDINHLSDRPRKRVLSAVNRSVEHGALVPVSLPKRLSDGRIRDFIHYGVNAEREPDASGAIYPDAYRAQNRGTDTVIPLFPEFAEPSESDDDL